MRELEFRNEKTPRLLLLISSCILLLLCAFKGNAANAKALDKEAVFQVQPIQVAAAFGNEFDVGELSVPGVSREVRNDGDSVSSYTIKAAEVNLPSVPKAAMATPFITYGDLFGLSEATFNQVALGAGSQDNLPLVLLYNDTGTTLYILGLVGDDVNEYTLSTPYDISSGSFDQIALSNVTQGSGVSARSMVFNGDGSGLYVLASNGNIQQYSLSTNYDISSAGGPTVITTFNGTAYTDMGFNDDGSKFFLINFNGTTIDEYGLSTPFDPSSAGALVTSLDVFNEEQLPVSFLFKEDGTGMFVLGLVSSLISEYTLSSPFDLTSASFLATALDYSDQDNSMRDIMFNDVGDKLYLLGTDFDNVYEYDMVGQFVETEANNGQVTGSLVVKITDDTFTGVNGEDFIANGKASISNVPPGLTASLVRISDDNLTLTLSGTALDHADINDVSSLIFTFTDAAFTGTSAAGVTDAIGASSGSRVDFIDNSAPTALSLSNTTVVENTAVVGDLTTTDADSGNTHTLSLVSGTGDEDNATFTIVGNTLSFITAPDFESPTDVGDGTGNNTYNIRVRTDDGNGGTFEQTFVITVTNEVPIINYNTLFDVSGVVFNQIALPVGTEETNPRNLLFNNTGTKLYLLGLVGNDITEYSLATPFDISSGTFDQVALSNIFQASGVGVRSMLFNGNGSKLYVLGSNGNIREYGLTVSYDISTANSPSIITTLNGFNGTDMTFSADGSKFFIINFSNATIREYSLGTPFDLSTIGSITNRLGVGDIESLLTSFIFNPEGTRLFALGLTTSQIIEYSLSTAFDLSTASFSETGFDFSHEDFTIRDMIFNDFGNKYYLLGTDFDNVYEYDMIGRFTEKISNVGEVEGDLTVLLSEESFTGVNGDDFIAAGKASISGVPPGLTPVLIRNSDTELTLTFTGNAIDHESINDVSSLIFTFTDAAFTATAASGVTNAVNADSGSGIDFIDNNAPIALSLSNSIVVENTTLVGDFTTTDPDNGNTHTLSLVSGIGDEDNGFFTIFGNTISFNTPPDFESPQDLGSTPGNNTYSIRVRTDDGNGGTLEAVFVITVIDQVAPGSIETDLSLWLNAGTGITESVNSVSSWQSQSTDAGNFTQGTALNQPTFTSVATNFNPSVTLDGNDNLSGDNIINGTEARTVFVVYDPTNTGELIELGAGNNGGQWSFTATPSLDVDGGVFEWNEARGTARLTSVNHAASASLTNAQSYFNGALVSGNLVSGTNQNINTGNTNTIVGDGYSGAISEVIAYNRELTQLEQQKVESYLALKYGITLSTDNDGDGSQLETATINEGDYLAANGTILWDASANSLYHYNVAGIVRDDLSGLNQKISTSVNSDAMLSIGLDADADGLEESNALNTNTFATNVSSLVWGHDNADLDGGTGSAAEIEFDPSEVKSRLNREWFVQKTGDVGVTTLEFNVSQLLGPDNQVGTSDESQIVLLVDADGDFSSGATKVFQSFVVNDDGLVVFQADITSSLYFTLASSEMGALPITFTSFNVETEEEYVTMAWTTAEIGEGGLFVIERSANGLDFSAIGSIQVDYNDGSHTFQDLAPLAGNSFYRIAAIDDSGVQTYSEIRSTSIEERLNIKLSVYPNPASNTIRLILPLPLQRPEVLIRSTSGHMASKIKINENEPEVSIDISHLSAGIYLVRLQGFLKDSPISKTIKLLVRR